MVRVTEGVCLWDSLVEMARIGAAPNGAGDRVALGDENGISHNQAENAKAQDLAAGCDVLFK